MPISHSLYRRLALVFGIAVAVATLLNGTSFWLKRVGWLQPQLSAEYRQFMQQAGSAAAADPAQAVATYRDRRDAYRDRFYDVDGIWVLSKLAKDVVIGAFVAVGIVYWLSIGGVPPPLRDWLLLALLAVLTVALSRSLWRYGPLVAMAGLRSFSFLLVAIVGTWAAGMRECRWLASSLVAVLLIQLLLAPIELVHGANLFTGAPLGLWRLDRLVGTLLQPTSLGTFAVVAMAWYAGSDMPAPRLLVVCAVAGALAVASASGTALALYVLAVGMVLYGRSSSPKARRRWWVIGAVLAVTAVNLPLLTGRFDIYDSLWGRLDRASAYLVDLDSALDLLAGRGLGIGTNVAMNLLRADATAGMTPVGEGVAIHFADSTALMMLPQIGLIGAVLFYALLIRIACRDRRYRVVHIVLLLASVTNNLGEFFPVNFLLGLLIARALGPSETLRAPTLRPAGQS